MSAAKFIIGLLFIISTINANAQINEMNMNNYSVEIIRYTIQKERGADFEKAYEKAGEYLAASPFCLGYNVLRGDEEPEHYIVTIYWTSKEEHLNGFRKSADFQKFLKLVSPYYNNIDEMKHYNKTSILWGKDKL